MVRGEQQSQKRDLFTDRQVIVLRKGETRTDWTPSKDRVLTAAKPSQAESWRQLHSSVESSDAEILEISSVLAMDKSRSWRQNLSWLEANHHIMLESLCYEFSPSLDAGPLSCSARSRRGSGYRSWHTCGRRPWRSRASRDGSPWQ